MSRIVRRIIANSALFMAVILVLSGVSGYLLISHEPKTEHLLSETQKEFLENKEERQNKIESAEYGGEVTHVDGSAIAKARENYSSSVEEYGIGSVYIPASEISLPLLAGTSEENLLNGVATASAEKELGEGLFIGMSHNVINQRLLQNIDQAEKDDLVYLTDFTDVYTYRITEQTVVHETESSYLKEPEENETAKLLLYRCEGEYNTDWRRIVYGDYIKKEKISEVDKDILKGLMIDVEVINSTEKLESDTQEVSTVEYQTEEDSKNIFEQIQTKTTDIISQKNILTQLFLRVYALADSYTIFFFMLVFLLFVIYYSF
ncbi:LPXTG-site transpeptidase (sortase) family protein [Halolactibacillus halophilus]|uniref:LPXTG-site transpeptidase (Sortase) family protein n=1 Tax=Halolactibacillus halophilus TaxID=306540 RepID=A0A1I5PWT6_9BACI|nr:class A sortase [Halolactibacillus halophilus]GEM02240.1 hypothetical protein HHA03_17720 [Halolactibacillus halophilus]SFP38563.1 LPXTG-site transpeptidase (sortase) family protein [Halolactibacillus halophilus]